MMGQMMVIKFVKLKNKIIKEATGIPYVDERDIEEIRGWSEETCQEIYKIMWRRIMLRKVYGFNDDCCPWCILEEINNWRDSNNARCYGCGYGIRHGQCGKVNSLFRKFDGLNLDETFSNKIYHNILSQVKQYAKSYRQVNKRR